MRVLILKLQATMAFLYKNKKQKQSWMLKIKKSFKTTCRNLSI